MREVGPYFAGAPTHDQAERIWWDDLKLLSFSDLHPRRPNESRKVITLPNGSTIHIIGLDKPSRIEGVPWKGGVIDEIADTKPKTWTSHVRPALDTLSPDGCLPWCWLIGVPDGLNHFYDICEQAKASPDWGYYQWASAEVLSPEVIAEAKRALSAREFRQEYEASFETATGRIYSDYSEDNHTTTTIQPHERLMWAHDFNFTPMSSCIAVKRGDAIHLLDEIVLESAVARQAAEEFVHRYAKHGNKSVVVYGDPAGKAGEKHAHASDYTEIERVLRQAGWSVERRVASKAPAITARQAAVRAEIKSAAGDVRLLVNPHTASWCHRALATVQYLPGSAYQEDQRNQYQHISTAIGYMIHREGKASGMRGTVGAV